MTSKLDRSVPVTLLAGADPVPGPVGAAAMVGTAIEVMGRQPSEVAVVAPWGWAEAARAAGVQRVAEVDAEVRYLTDRCACCTVRADLYGPMSSLTRGAERAAEILVIDTTGTPTVAARTLLEPEADGRGGRLHRTLFALSGPAATASMVDGASSSPLAHQGLLLADAVLISDAASCSLQGRRRLRSEISARTPLARVVLVGRPTPPVPAGWTAGRATPPPSRHLGPTSWHGPHGGLHLAVSGHLDRDLVYAWLNARRDELGDQLVRMSAVLSIAGAEVPTRLTGIGRASLIRRIDAWTGPRHSSVVLLATGWPGDVEELASDLAGCVAHLGS